MVVLRRGPVAGAIKTWGYSANSRVCMTYPHYFGHISSSRPPFEYRLGWVPKPSVFEEEVHIGLAIETYSLGSVGSPSQVCSRRRSIIGLSIETNIDLTGSPSRVCSKRRSINSLKFCFRLGKASEPGECARRIVVLGSAKPLSQLCGGRGLFASWEGASCPERVAPLLLSRAEGGSGGPTVVVASASGLGGSEGVSRSPGGGGVVVAGGGVVVASGGGGGGDGRHRCVAGWVGASWVCVAAGGFHHTTASFQATDGNRSSHHRRDAAISLLCIPPSRTAKDNRSSDHCLRSTPMRSPAPPTTAATPPPPSLVRSQGQPQTS
ncbi:hypothetical protein Fmac_009355 [Flemingia macrophylla]|uniref:Uncharacterized protein n=1 Tax=Flemingia macrophylla TaxID=520843 RepID=A0ABD1N006_9FABA